MVDRPSTEHAAKLLIRRRRSIPAPSGFCRVLYQPDVVEITLCVVVMSTDNNSELEVIQIRIRSVPKPNKKDGYRQRNVRQFLQSA